MIIHEVLQGTTNWMALRAGLPTASCFDKLITSTGEVSKSLQGYAITLAGEKYAGKPLDAFEGNGYTERGKLLEQEARTAYTFLHDAPVLQVGFVTDDYKQYGCSPDGFVEIDGLVEFKCLKAENHIKALLYYGKHKKCPPDYIQQTQGQIMICEREWCDLMFYHPDLPKLVIRQFRDDKKIITSTGEVSKSLQGYSLHALLLSAINQVINERDRIYDEIVALNGVIG